MKIQTDTYINAADNYINASSNQADNDINAAEMMCRDEVVIKLIPT